MNWSDPNWVGAIGQWISALASFLAVAVALGVAIWSAKQAQKQFQQTRYDEAKPILIIDGNVLTQSSHGDWLAQSDQNLTIKNAGKGVAFDVMSVIYPPESIIYDQKRLDQTIGDPNHWTFITSYFEEKYADTRSYKHMRCIFFKENRKIGKYSFFAPARLENYYESKEPIYLCRVTTTYRDIFKRKHASIFDLDVNKHWTQVAILEDISEDLHDLEGHKEPPMPTLWENFKNRLPRLIWPRNAI